MLAPTPSSFTWLLVLSALLILIPRQIQAAPASSTNGSSVSYDFVIVGGGTAGLALASRLSTALSSSQILVIEAGSDGRQEPHIYIPGYKGTTLGTKYDWNFTTVPQPHALDRKVAQNRGKVLGGSSALNLMSWDRASAIEYEVWAKLGNDGWDWNSMLPAMLKAENFVRTPFPPYGQTGVGEGGPIQTVINEYIPKQQLSFIPAVNRLGIPQNLESLGGNPIGVMYQPSNVRRSNYTRSYSPDYLKLAASNLHVMSNTTVLKVLTEPGSDGQVTATGVLLGDGTTISAKKEVILSTGSFQSPILLEMSGIGNPSILEQAHIAPIVNLPGVGENLQDHIRIQNSYQLKPSYISFDQVRVNATYAAEQLALWYAAKRSYYDYTGSGYIFANWTQIKDASPPDLISLAEQAAAADSSPITQQKLAYLKDSTLSQHVPQIEVVFSDGYTGVKGYPANTSSLYGQSFFTLIASVQHPFSRGSVHINTTLTDMTTMISTPVIDPRYLSTAYDLHAATTASKWLRTIANTSPLKDVWVAEYEPGDAVQSDAAFETFARNTTLTLYHPLGTCAMLPRHGGGVVDPELKVYGTTNLRVVDASVIPILISAHIQTAVYGVAERAAEILTTKYT